MAEVEDRRSLVTEAFEKSLAGDAGKEAELEVPEAEELTGAETAPEGDGDADASQLAGDGAQDEDATEAEKKARDEKGRFAKKEAEAKAAKAAKAKAGKKDDEAAGDAAAAGAAAAEQPGAEKPAPQQASAEKPPASWKPAARELFGKLPPEVRSEVVRREKETSVALQRAAEAHKAAEGSGRIVQAVQSVLAPFEPHIRAAQAAKGEQYNPLTVIGSLLRTAHTLETAAPLEKAKVLAGFMRQYGVNVDVMNEVLGGQPAGEGAQHQAPPAYRDPRVDELLAANQRRDEEITKQRTAYQQQVEAETARELQDFASTHEYYEDVRDEMSVILHAATAKGRTISLEDAYKQAVRMNPDVAPIVEQKEAAQRAKAKAAAAQRTRAASSSVRSTPAARPAPAGGAQPDDRRSQIESLWDEGTARI